jgi:hypothetical protein
MLFTTLAMLFLAAETVPAPTGVIAHEWGTFTSVAAADGSPMVWFALGGPAKLPCFVHHSETLTKTSVYTTVRMETPVVYFYSQLPAELSVAVDFRQGALTEWYPQARNDSPGRLEWRHVQLAPGEDLTLPSSGEGNHYYAARATDAAPLRVDKEQEKLLFYRGAGVIDVPLRPQFTADGKIQIRTTQPVAAAFVFENREGKMGYRALHDLRETTVVEAPSLNSDAPALREQLAAELVKAGLYPKEARAMIETWHDSWFEEGMRVMYLVPRTLVDKALPLEIAPATRETSRVFVGRVEMLSPAVKTELEAAVAHRDRAGVAKYGRFAQSFWQTMHGTASYIPADLRPEGTGGCAR